MLIVFCKLLQRPTLLKRSVRMLHDLYLYNLYIWVDNTSLLSVYKYDARSCTNTSIPHAPAFVANTTVT